MLTNNPSKNVGLVLEGGAMRGMFTAGVIDVWLENGITFPEAAGVSAGATFGGNLKSRQTGRVIRYNKRFCRDPRYGTFRSLLKTGDVFDAEFCWKILPNELDKFDAETFARDPMRFWVVATDVENGEPVYHECAKGDSEDIQWFRASSSMPLVSKPVALDGRLLVDGGVGDSIPLKFMESRGFEHNVLVLTQPRGFQKKQSGLWPLIRFVLRRHPGLVRAMRERPKAYNETLAYVESREAAGTAFVIRPPEPLGISHLCHDPEELQRVYDIGRQTANETLPALKKFIAG